MTMKTPHEAVVIGATGDVGRGITAQLLRAGSRVLAVARDQGKLDSLQREFGGLGRLETHKGDVSTPEQASRLQDYVCAWSGRLSAVVVSVNAPARPVPLQQLDADALLGTVQANVLTHLHAARAFLPAMPEGSRYLSIGGGMADWVAPGYAAVSMCQAAQRMLLRYLAAEYEGRGVMVQELMLHSMINGASRRQEAQPGWLTDEEVGQHVCFMLEHPALFTEVVVNLKSRKQVAQPPLARS